MNRLNGLSKRTLLLSVLLLLTSSATLAQNVWAWEDVESTEIGSGYEFVWHRPYLTKVPGEPQMVHQWHNQLEEMIKSEKKSFIKHFRETQAESEAEVGKDHKWRLEGGYKVVWQDKLNLILSWSGYSYSGGAHGNHLQKLSIVRKGSFEVYDSSAFLFDHDPAALEVLSRESRVGLVKYLGEEFSDDHWLLKGSAPEWKNFSMCYPTTNEKGQRVFRVTFSPYQVGPYAIGTPSVDISWKKLAPYAVNLIF